MRSTSSSSIAAISSRVASRSTFLMSAILVGDEITTAALPAWASRQVSLPGLSISKPCVSCLMVATRCPRRASSATSFSRSVVLPTLDLPTTEITGAIATSHPHPFGPVQHLHLHPLSRPNLAHVLRDNHQAVRLRHRGQDAGALGTGESGVELGPMRRPPDVLGAVLSRHPRPVVASPPVVVLRQVVQDSLDRGFLPGDLAQHLQDRRSGELLESDHRGDW